jgi:hypothetical protein
MHTLEMASKITAIRALLDSMESGLSGAGGGGVKCKVIRRGRASVALAIPKGFALEAGLVPGGEVVLEELGGELVISRAKGSGGLF